MERVYLSGVLNAFKDKSTRFAFVLLLSVAACIPLSGNASAETSETPLWSITPDPDWGSQAEIVTTENTDGGRYYNVVESHQRHENNPAHSISYRRYVYTIKNDSGVDGSDPISIDFDPVYQTVNLHRAVIHRDGEVINQLHRDNIQVLQRETQLEDGLYDGNQTLHFLLSDQRVGDRIEYSYSIIGDNPVFEGHLFGWTRLQASVSVGNYYFRLQYPEHLNVTTRTYKGDITPEKINTAGYQQLTWQNKNTPAVEYQSDVPSSYIGQTYIQYTDFTDWSAVATWAGPLYKPDTNTHPDIKAQADKIKSEWPTTEQQIDAAIVFVQDKIRYTGINSGIGGFKPDPVETILERRYGDCKDKAVLLVALLREFGVTAYPALVHTSEGAAISDYLPAPDAFNHMIAKLPDYKGDDYWIDGTATLQGSTLSSLYQGDYERALVPAEVTKGLQTYKTPSSDLPFKKIVEQYNLHHNSEAENTTLTITSVYRSYSAESMRRTLQNKGKRKLQTDYLNYYENRFETIDISNPMEVKDDRKANVLTTIEHYTIDDAWEKSEDYSDEKSTAYMLSLHADTISAPLSVPSDRRRHQPLAQSHPVNIVHQIELTTADGWEIEGENLTIGNDYFDYVSSSSVEDTTLTLSYSLRTHHHTVQARDGRRYVKDLRNMLDDPYYQVWFEFPVVSENLQNLNNQLSDIGTWFKQTADVLSSTEP